MMDKLRGAMKSVTIWVNLIFAGVISNADSIVSGLHSALPDLSQYLPTNIFKVIGVLLIVFNLYQRTRTNQSLADKGQK